MAASAFSSELTAMPISLSGQSHSGFLSQPETIFLRKIVSGCDKKPEWLCPESEIGMAVNSLEKALAAIEKIRRRGHHKIIVKEALGVAGSNAMRLFEPELLETQKRWMQKA